MSDESMEVFLKDKLSGEQHAVHIGEGDTPVQLKAIAFDVVLGSPPDALPEDVELAVDGEVLDDSAPLCGAAGVSQGCCIDVALSGARFVEVLQNQKRSRYVDFDTIPAWAQRLRDVALAVVQCDGNALQDLDESFYSDKHIVTAALHTSGGLAFKHASEDLRGDEDVVLAAFYGQTSLQDDPMAPSDVLMHASPALLRNKPFVLTLVRRAAGALQHVDATLQADIEVVMAAVQRHGDALQYACASLRNDREVMLTAVRLSGDNFKHASSALRQDTGFQREAVLWDGGVLEYIPKAVQPCSSVPLHQDRDLLLAAVETFPAALQHAHPSLQGDKGVVLAAMHSRGCDQYYALRCAPSHLKKDKEVVLAGVRHDPYVLREADDSLRTNRDFVLQCVKLQGRALRYAHLSVCSDTEVQLAAVAQDPIALQYRGVSIRHRALRFANHTLRNSKRDVVLAAVRQDGCALQYAPTELCCDKEVVLEAVRADPDAFIHASAPLRRDSDVVAAAFPERHHRKRHGCIRTREYTGQTAQPNTVRESVSSFLRMVWPKKSELRVESPP